jgi:hypothetical protein
MTNFMKHLEKSQLSARLAKFNYNEAAKTVLTVGVLVAWNLTMGSNAQIANAVTAVSGICKNLLVPALMLFALVGAVWGTLKGLKQLQDEQDGVRTILVSIIFGAIVGGAPAVAGGIIAIPGVPTPSFCQ